MYRWVVKRDGYTSEVIIEKDRFDSLSVESQKSLLKLQLVKAHTKIINELIQIV